MFRRGFKAWCESIAIKYRQDFGLNPEDRFPPQLLSEKLGVLIWSPEDIPGLAEKDLAQLTKHDSSSWSACTLRLPTTDLIIVNSSHSAVRQTSSTMHELAHLILDHEPARLDVSEMGHLLLHSYDSNQEDEADWLSATLLVPREGLLRHIFQSHTVSSSASHFGVSNKLLNWRKQMTGVETQAGQRLRKE